MQLKQGQLYARRESPNFVNVYRLQGDTFSMAVLDENKRVIEFYFDVVSEFRNYHHLFGLVLLTEEYFGLCH